MWPASKNQYPVLKGFTFDELYEPKEKDWNGQIQYELKNNIKNPKTEMGSEFHNRRKQRRNT
jgi:hypothetical protein